MNTGFQGLTINVIYVKDTPILLLPFLNSLIYYSDCHYRLISNGCSVEDEVQLKSFVEGEKRASFLSMKSENILKHHEVLHKVLALEQSSHFVFMDSDIIAKAPFLDKLLKKLEGKQAVFTGLPIWHEENERVMPRKFRIMGGRYYKSHNGHELGLSYAAIYRTEELKAFMSSSGLDLKKYIWEEIPAAYQEVLISLDLKKHIYDTAKVLNIIWQYQGALMSYVENKALLHIGGVSGQDSRNNQHLKFKQSTTKLLVKVIVSMVKNILQQKDRLTIEETLNMDQLVKKRRLAEKLLVKDLLNKSSDDSSVYLTMLPAEVADNIKKARPEIQQTLDTFGIKSSQIDPEKKL